MFQIPGAEIRKALEPKVRLWRGTDSNKMAEEIIDLVSLCAIQEVGMQGTVENRFVLLYELKWQF